jgi:N-carbamoylputrescine amidase
MELITAYDVPKSLARVEAPEREPFRIGLVQQRWHEDPQEHRAVLAEGVRMAAAEVLVYPTAIGSEPDHPDFDTQPLWERVIVANGIANGTFMVAVNRIGEEPPLRFYGSSFVSDPYGRVLAQAPRDRPAVIVADLDLDQRRDWLALFPFLTTRRPDAYGVLVDG